MAMTLFKAIIILVLTAVFITHKSTAQNCQEVGCAPGFCCSSWGFCGDSPLHCASSGPSNNSFGNACNPPCGRGFCCSRWGFCGDSPLHCAGGGAATDTPPVPCNPPCAPGFCCSRWGFCGDSPLHCAGGGAATDTPPIPCNPPCAPGFCCSRWGFCGNTPLHCNGGFSNDTAPIPCNPPCAPGLCCSKWGFCGNTPLHCFGVMPTPPPELGRCPPPCAPGMCCSKFGYCGSTPEYCDGSSGGGGVTGGGGGVTGGGGGNPDSVLTREIFDCIFDTLDPAMRDKRWNGLQEALSMVPFPIDNLEETMMFLGHVSHETDGLQTYEEYCGKSGECANNYQDSWCSPVEAEPGKQYYGRGWFQLSWPCNYDAAGNALKADLLQNPDQVAESDTLAAATALWFWNNNNMGKPAREGNFGGTTQIINKIECGPTPQQNHRVERYQKVRKCFSLPEETNNLKC